MHSVQGIYHLYAQAQKKQDIQNLSFKYHLFRFCYLKEYISEQYYPIKKEMFQEIYQIQKYINTIALYLQSE